MAGSLVDGCCCCVWRRWRKHGNDACWNHPHWKRVSSHCMGRNGAPKRCCCSFRLHSHYRCTSRGRIQSVGCHSWWDCIQMWDWHHYPHRRGWNWGLCCQQSSAQSSHSRENGVSHCKRVEMWGGCCNHCERAMIDQAVATRLVWKIFHLYVESLGQ